MTTLESIRINKNRHEIKCKNVNCDKRGFEDQMLSLVAIQERPDLEQARNALIILNAEMRRELKEIEDRILYRLSVSEGSAVDDMDLILTLEASKLKSEEIKVHFNLVIIILIETKYICLFIYYYHIKYNIIVYYYITLEKKK